MHIRNLHARINLDFNHLCICTIFSWVTVILICATCGASGTVGRITHCNMGNFKNILKQLWNYIWLWCLVFKELLEYCHVAMCNSATSATCATSGTNLTTTVTQPKIVQMHWGLKSRLILACRFRICTQNLHINNTFVDIRCLICHSLINKLIN